MKKITVDGHVDTLLNFNSSNYSFGERNTSFHVDLPRIQEIGNTVLVFAACQQGMNNSRSPLARTIQLIDRFHTLIEKYNSVGLVRNYSDLENYIKEDKISLILAIEGADGIFDLSALRTFYRLGVRFVTLTWNKRNLLADGLWEADTGGGLTGLGKMVVAEMEKLGMVIDVSHISPAGFRDVLSICRQPVVVSHANVKSIIDVRRNLSDRQIKLIADSGGIIGLNFCPSFLTGTDEANISDVIMHTNYIKGLVGMDYVGLGTDFDGIENTPTGLEHVGKLPELRREMENYFTEREIDKFFQHNWLRIFKRILGGG